MREKGRLFHTEEFQLIHLLGVRKIKVTIPKLIIAVGKTKWWIWKLVDHSLRRNRILHSWKYLPLKYLLATRNNSEFTLEKPDRNCPSQRAKADTTHHGTYQSWVPPIGCSGESTTLLWYPSAKSMGLYLTMRKQPTQMEGHFTKQRVPRLKTGYWREGWWNMTKVRADKSFRIYSGCKKEFIHWMNITFQWRDTFIPWSKHL